MSAREPMLHKDDYDEPTAQQNKRKKAYFFQACALLAFGVIMTGAYGKLYEVLCMGDSSECDDSFSLELYLAAAVILMAGSGLPILFYCCQCSPKVKYVMVTLLITSSILYFAGAAEQMDAEGTNAQNSEYAAVPIGLFLICCVTSVQILSEKFNEERRRVPAFAFALLTFGLLYPWHLFTKDDATGSETAAAAGCVIMDIALVVTMFLLCCKQVRRLWRFVLCLGIFGGAVILFAGLWSYYGVTWSAEESTAADEAWQVYLISPGIFAVTQAAVLSLDVLV